MRIFVRRACRSGTRTCGKELFEMQKEAARRIVKKWKIEKISDAIVVFSTIPGRIGHSGHPRAEER